MLAGFSDEAVAFGLHGGFTTGEERKKKEEGSEDSHCETSEVVRGVCLM